MHKEYDKMKVGNASGTNQLIMLAAVIFRFWIQMGLVSLGPKELIKFRRNLN